MTAIPIQNIYYLLCYAWISWKKLTSWQWASKTHQELRISSPAS